LHELFDHSCQTISVTRFQFPDFSRLVVTVERILLDSVIVHNIGAVLCTAEVLVMKGEERWFHSSISRCSH